MLKTMRRNLLYLLYKFINTSQQGKLPLKTLSTLREAYIFFKGHVFWLLLNEVTGENGSQEWQAILRERWRAALWPYQEQWAKYVPRGRSAE